MSGWPFTNVFMPADSTSWTWTKTSEPPPSGAMKPYPRSALKNLTRPVGIFQLPVNAITRRLLRGTRFGGPAPAATSPGTKRGANVTPPAVRGRAVASVAEDNAGKLAARPGSTIGLARRGSYLLDRTDGTVAKAT